MHRVPSLPRLSRLHRLAGTVALGAALLLAVAGCGGATATTAVTFPPDAVVITAEGSKFSTAQLAIPAGREFPLVFINKDGVQHNLSITASQDLAATPLFRFDFVTATTVVLTAPAIPAGTYFFHCEVHPDMNGTVIAR